MGVRIRARMYPETASPPAADTSIIRRISSFSKSSPHPFSFALVQPVLSIAGVLLVLSVVVSI